MRKASGVLLSIFSLPSKYGIGCFSKEAYQFVDWLKEAGQEYWQILPLGPTGFGDSPYQSFSTFSGNPYFIDLESLIDAGLLTEAECDEVDFGNDPLSIDYEKIYNGRYKLLRKAYERSNISSDSDYQEFVKKNDEWLDDYSLFMAIKNSFDGIAWPEWPDDIRNREEKAVEEYKAKLSDDIEFQKYMQYLFFTQWFKLRAYANKNGVKMIGDIPIYVALDSSDVWANPELFQLDEDHNPYAVAGVPPDGFSPTGQLWGNPLYKWEYHKETGYSWWADRMNSCFDLYDVVRIDHFRGFAEYYSVPSTEDTAVNGEWIEGPGIELFNAIEKKIGKKPVIAEDLGFVTETVKKLVEDSGFPGMKVLEFGFDERDTGYASDYLPHNYDYNAVAYTATHDNSTIVGWWDEVSEGTHEMVRDYLGDYYTPDDKLYVPMIAALMRSNAKLCIIPMQDYLGYDDSTRMNVPSTVGDNWKWRLNADDLTEELQEKVKKMAKLSGRYNQ